MKNEESKNKKKVKLDEGVLFLPEDFKDLLIEHFGKDILDNPIIKILTLSEEEFAEQVKPASPITKEEIENAIKRGWV